MSINVFTPSVPRCKTWIPISTQLCTLSGSAQTFFTPRAVRNISTVNKTQMGTARSNANVAAAAAAAAGSRRALIISGYTCIGKTFFCNNEELRSSLNLGEVVDLDSSSYPRDNFPANYLEDIRRAADAPGAPRVLLVSTFPGVATQLRREGYYVAQVYPDGGADCRREWLGRLENREEGGRDSRLYKLVSDNWDAWFEEMGARDVSDSKVVSATDYLSNVIQEIYEAFSAHQGGGAEAGERKATPTSLRF